MSVTDELNELIALHGNCRDALNVTLAKLRQAQSEIAVLKEAAQQSVQADVLASWGNLGNCTICGLAWRECGCLAHR